MSYSEQARQLSEQGAEMRRGTFGVDQKGEPQKGIMCDDAGNAVPGAIPFDCYFSPFASSELIETSHFKDVHDGVLRVGKSEPRFQPVIGKCVKLFDAKPDGDLAVRLAEVGHSGINSEYVFGCKNIE